VIMPANAESGPGRRVQYVQTCRRMYVQACRRADVKGGVLVPRRMTIVFDDEQLYTHLKVEAARSHRPAKDIVARALELYFEATGDEYEVIMRRVSARNGRSEGVGRVLEQLGIRR